MTRPATSKVDLVELAYALDRQPQQWLHDLGATLRGTIPGIVNCYAFEVSRVAGRVTLGEHWVEEPLVGEQLRKTFAEASDELLDLFNGAPLLAKMTSAVLAEAGISISTTPLPAAYAAMGVVDQFAVSATDPSGRGAVLGMSLDNHDGPSPEDRVMLAQIGAHVAAGARLRRRLGGRPAIDEADAVLRPSGELEHLDDATAPSELLREAVARVERARSRRADEREALELWQGLVAGQWSLVDHFEGSGRRYYVAVCNSTQAAASRALTRREAEVVAYLASGTSTKATAYALGLDMVTVRGYLRSAMAKLGVRTRAELIGLRAMLLPPELDRGEADGEQP
ncbi:Bacterial regulatory protein, luxR family [Enhygromyxa salina]|uniref:Bacterial regulatory protein, luxR family n=1 Tax=Enhygromyxa salina TaxID=215803 RepID=A0A2S9YLC6_9BACT|nr:helix-turn-helix transcriptional regulator [Enhygromyxa salina]PRQ05905.1 Bacterial regulatory protein, luxR family [Enhygromyxa salina]